MNLTREFYTRASGVEVDLMIVDWTSESLAFRTFRKQKQNNPERQKNKSCKNFENNKVWLLTVISLSEMAVLDCYWMQATALRPASPKMLIDNNKTINNNKTILVTRYRFIVIQWKIQSHELFSTGIDTRAYSGRNFKRICFSCYRCSVPEGNVMWERGQNHILILRFGVLKGTVWLSPAQH